MLSSNDKNYTNVKLETRSPVGARDVIKCHLEFTVSPTVGKMSVLDLFY